LTGAFILVAAVSAGVLALVTIGLTREYGWRTFRERSEDESRVALTIAPADLTEGTFERLVAAYTNRSGANTLALAGDAVYTSSPGLSADDVPAQLRDPPRQDVASANTTIDGTRYLVVGGTAAHDVRYYFFFSQTALRDTFRDLQLVLAAGWLVTVAVAAAIGQIMARETLRPVRAASEAATSVADGLLETRLPSASDDEFGAWAESFNRMAEALQTTIARLADAVDRERRFTADVAHELRTPLTGLAAAAAVLDDERARLPPDARRAANILVTDARRLRDLVLELLELAELDAGSKPTLCEPLLVRDAVDAVVRTLPATNGHGAMVRLDVDPQLKVFADRSRFRSVVANLLQNALVHGGEPVDVRAWRDNGEVVIEVVDSGDGIPADELPHVFDRFFKSDDSRASGGSGLGLAIAYEQAKAQAGTLTVANDVQRGARFSLRLPAPSVT
jgi:two-component system sensor histidine kinase MtrB